MGLRFYRINVLYNLGFIGLSFFVLMRLRIKFCQICLFNVKWDYMLFYVFLCDMMCRNIEQNFFEYVEIF